MIKTGLLFSTIFWSMNLILTGQTAFSQTAIVLSEQKFNEHYDPDRGRVSGDIVMGVMIGPDPQNNKDEDYADFSPRGSANVVVQRLPTALSVGQTSRPFCVRINSKDGRFEAENTYTVSGEVSPQTPFKYLGQHSPDLNSMDAVTLVKVGPCGNRTQTVVPSTWADRDMVSKAGALHVFVNSAGNPTGLVVGSDRQIIECADVTEETTLKYTSACVIPFERIEPQIEDSRVTLTFFVSRSLEEEVFNLAVIFSDLG